MEWALATLVLTGFLAGYRFRAVVLILLSVLTFFIAMFALVSQGYSLTMSIGLAFAMTFTLQLSYLLGAGVVYGLRRWLRVRRPSGGFGKEAPLPKHASRKC
jgi:hypothetical protein